MTGPYDSVIGIKKEAALERFLNQMPQKFTIARGDLSLNAVLIKCDPETGLSSNIERLQIPLSQ
jgi:calcineurin-like phosphoesterase